MNKKTKTTPTEKQLIQAGGLEYIPARTPVKAKPDWMNKYLLRQIRHNVLTDRDGRLKALALRARTQAIRRWFTRPYNDTRYAERLTLVDRTTLGDVADLDPEACPNCLGTGDCPACKDDDDSNTPYECYCPVCHDYQACEECEGTGRKDGAVQ